MSNNNDASWKEKYLRGLDELEQKEKQWAELEDLLRRGIGRLAHTGYGAHPRLDRQLDQIREAVRARRDGANLERLAREASEIAVETQEAQAQACAEAGRLLAQILAQAPLGGARRRRAERLAKQLEKGLALLDLPALLTEAAPLLANAPNEADGPASAPRPGLLERLLGGREDTPAASPTAAPTPPAQPRATLTALEGLLDQLQQEGPWQARLTQLRQQAAACREETEACELLNEVAAVLAEILEVAKQAGPDSRVVVDSLPSAGEALLELLQKLELPGHLQERVNLVKTALVNATSPQQVRLVVQSIADLLEAVRREVQQEKRELERFIVGLTDRIQHLSENMTELGANRDESSAAQRAFQGAFRERMAGIRDTVRDSGDIERLKRAIVEGLDAIETHMEEYARREELLAKAATDKIQDLSRRLHDMRHEAHLLQQKMTEQHRQALRDPLTGIHNRLAYEERVAAEFGRWRRYGQPLSLVVMDIDHFKRINDGFGHLAGDKALKAVATRLAQNMREVDLVARYGGEEFVLLLPNTQAEQAVQVAEKLRLLVATAGFHYHNQPVAVTLSGGVAEACPGDDPHSLFKRADEALYAAKQGGRNRTQLASAPPPAASPQGEAP